MVDVAEDAWRVGESEIRLPSRQVGPVVPGIIRTARRPEGWVAPGPAPRGDDGRVDLQPQGDEDLCFLTGDWRLFQKQRGHRWSLDDLLTAHLAAKHIKTLDAPHVLDLGCGLGSVLLMLAWRFPEACVTGIEAQVDRAAMGRRSILWNGVEARCQILDGDIRSATLFPERTTFPLITGTPPYFPRGSGPESDKAHAAACRFEMRGGIEEYAQAASRWLSPDGHFVVCTAALEAPRVLSAAHHSNLHRIEHLEVIPREGKEVLVMIDVFSRKPRPLVNRQLTVRKRDGQWTNEFQAVRSEMGLPPRSSS